MKIFLILLLLFCPYILLSADNNLWVNFEIGGGSNDNVYKDYSSYSDTVSNLGLMMRTYYRLPKGWFSWWDYKCSLKNFNIREDRSYLLNTVASRIKKNLSDWGIFEVNLCYELYQQPNYNYYDSQHVSIFPELQYYLYDYTILSIGFLNGSFIYPNYVLDYQAYGGNFKILQEFSFFTSLELNLFLQIKDYPEWHVIVDSSGVLSPDHQKADHAKFKTTFSHETRAGKIQVYYLYSTLNSNANYLDYGTDIQPSTGDEILINEYYDHSKHKTGLTWRGKITKKLYLYGGISFEDIFYSGRLAKDEDYNLSEETRHDRKSIAYLSLSYPLFKLKSSGLNIKISYDFENNLSNDFFFNYQNNVFSILISGWL